MISASRKLVTLLAVLAAAALYILLGASPGSFTTTVSIILLICGLVVLFLVNAYVAKNTD
jgi:hypothetical protein